MKQKYIKPEIKATTVELEQSLAAGSASRDNFENEKNGWGHHKDDPDFPGNNGNGHNKF